MQMRFRLFVQQHHDGAFTVRAPTIPGVSAYAPTHAAALAAIREQLAEHLKNTDRRAWGKLAFEERQELRPLAVALSPKGKGPQPPIPTTVNLLIADTQASRNARYLVVTAPRVERFHLVVEDAAQLEALAREALIHHTRKWTSLAIVEADLTGPESLETIAVEVPDEEEPEQ